MEFQKNVSLKNYTTFKIGGMAKYFFKVRTKEDLIKAVNTAKKLKLPFFVLGGGSNLLVSDKGYDGIAIKIKNEKLKIKNKNKKFKNIYCEAGVLLGEIVDLAIQNNLTGLEWAIGIPGTVGGAVFGNAGAFQKSMKDIVKEVEVLDAKDLRFKIYDFKKCKFGYRNSVFKRKKNLIILSVVFKLKKEKKSEIKKKIKKCLNYKKERQPLDYPSAGSIFKNPSGFSAGELGEESKLSSSPFAAARQGEEDESSSSTIAAAWLIEKCGLKGKIIGQAKISEKHANFIVNLGNARAKDVKKLINLIKKEVKKKFGVLLDEEIQFL
ncbi:MAG: UDP-N-acetylmuramate dehydrogenase [Candidatus Nealsonbacteria bacterium]|nr:UDP-N-acetylmuramate dehydrogenase [Candidatus Nealsonbacteria bacterium]